MALKGTLYIPDAGDSFTVLECEYYICRNMETNGTGARPSITNFKITIIAPEKCRFFYTWLLKDNDRHDGQLDLIVEAKDKTHFKINFKSAYCKEIYEGYNSRWENNMMVMILFISPEEIELLDGQGHATAPSGIRFNNKTGVANSFGGGGQRPEIMF